MSDKTQTDMGAVSEYLVHDNVHPGLGQTTDNSEQLGACPPQPSNGFKTLVVMLDGGVQYTLRLLKAESPMLWQAVESITLPSETVDFMLFVQSNEENNVTFLYISMAEMLALTLSGDDNTSRPATSDGNVCAIKIRPTICLKPNVENSNLLNLADLMGHIENKVKLYQFRFGQTQDIDNINKIISYRETQLAIQSCSILGLPNGSAITSSPRCKNTACSYLHHYESLGNIRESANNRVKSHLQSYYRMCLGEVYSIRHRYTGHSRDTDHAIFHLENALLSIPAGQSSLFSCHGELGIAYTDRFQNTGDIQDINQAISHLKTVIQSAPRNHPSFSAWRRNLGIAYLELYKHTDDPEDTESAMLHLKEALKLNVVGSQPHSALCRFLGNVYMDRFSHTGDFEDIKQGISHLEKALTSVSGINKALCHCNLGNAYSHKFHITGQLKDISIAISYLHDAIPSLPTNHPVLANGYRSLADAYFEKYNRTADPEDNEHSISYYEKALESVSAGHSSLFACYGSLGTAYGQKFAYSRNVTDINLAISHFRNAIQFTPAGNSDLYTSYINLGTAYAAHFQLTGDLESSTNAITNLQNVIRSIPAGHRTYCITYTNLGALYLEHFKRTSKIDDINLTIKHFLKALRFAPSGDPTLFLIRGKLGSAYTEKYLKFGNNSDARLAVHAYLRASDTEGEPSERLLCASRAALLSREYDPTQSLNIFTRTIDLLAEVVGLEDTIQRHFSNLTRASHAILVRNAVYTSLAACKEELALEWIEQGRCLVWNQYSLLRTPLIDKLRIKNFSLANRFVDIVNALDSDRSRQTKSHAASGLSFLDDISVQNLIMDHVNHADEYRVILDEIRRLPDFHDFLKPRRCFDILSMAPKEGPIVIINAHHVRCDAVAIIHGANGPLHIPLETLSLKKIETLQNELMSITGNRDADAADRLKGRLVRSEEPLSKVLKTIWIEIVRPILNALAYSEIPPKPADRSRIWWCPTGPLVFLPLHAAGIYGSEYKSGSRVSDFVVSSYTPSVQSISEKSQAAASTTSSDLTRLLLISQPHTPGMAPIRFTTKETQDVELLFKDKPNVSTTLLQDNEATVASVSRALNEHNWAHFACHGIQDRADPLKSGVCVYDDRLDLLKIIQQRNPHSEFAFCSSCQSSKGDIKLSEEAVHLAAVMLAVGYRGVVGTMWSISDSNVPDFANFFYKYLLDNAKSRKLDSTRAAYALDYATRQVREKFGDTSEKSLLTWVPYVHYGY